MNDDGKAPNGDDQHDGQGDGKAPNDGAQSVPYDRFAEVNKRAKAAEAELAKLKKGAEDAAAEKAKRDGDLEALYNAEKSKREALELSVLRMRVATEAGIPAELIDSVTGATEDDMKASAERLAKYVKNAQAPNIDGPTGGTQPIVYTKEQLSDPAFYAKHRDDIMRAMGEGRIK